MKHLNADLLRTKVAPQLSGRDIIQFAGTCRHIRRALRFYVSQLGDTNVDMLYRLSYCKEIDDDDKRKMLLTVMQDFSEGRIAYIEHLILLWNSKR